MAYKIVWSKDAGDELVEIASYFKDRTGKNKVKKLLEEH
jgi:hypothetical protein